MSKVKKLSIGLIRSISIPIKYWLKYYWQDDEQISVIYWVFKVTILLQFDEYTVYFYIHIYKVEIVHAGNYLSDRISEDDFLRRLILLWISSFFSDFLWHHQRKQKVKGVWPWPSIFCVKDKMKRRSLCLQSWRTNILFTPITCMGSIQIYL